VTTVVVKTMPVWRDRQTDRPTAPMQCAISRFAGTRGAPNKVCVSVVNRLSSSMHRYRSSLASSGSSSRQQSHHRLHLGPASHPHTPERAWPHVTRMSLIIHDHPGFLIPSTRPIFTAAQHCPSFLCSVAHTQCANSGLSCKRRSWRGLCVHAL